MGVGGWLGNAPYGTRVRVSGWQDPMSHSSATMRLVPNGVYVMDSIQLWTPARCQVKKHASDYTKRLSGALPVPDDGDIRSAMALEST